MQPFNRPIGSSVIAPRQISAAGMAVSVDRASAPSEALDLRGAFKIDSYPNNSVIYRPNEIHDRVFLLKNGRVRLLRVGRDGAKSVTGILKTGDIFGDAQGVAGAGDEMAIASGECELWTIDGRDFRSHIESRPSLALEVFRAYAERVRALQQRVLGLTFKEVPARLADTLLSLAEAHGEPCPHGAEVDLRAVTQQDLADLVGASRSFVSTLINDMKRDGMLGNVGRTICLKDQRALRKLAAKEK